MTEHLPECMTSVVRMNYDCICPELRACEERVLDAAEQVIPHDTYCESLDEHTNDPCDCWWRPKVIAAIRALKKES